MDPNDVDSRRMLGKMHREFWRPRTDASMRPGGSFRERSSSPWPWMSFAVFKDGAYTINYTNHARGRLQPTPTRNFSRSSHYGSSLRRKHPRLNSASGRYDADGVGESANLENSAGGETEATNGMSSVKLTFSRPTDSTSYRVMTPSATRPTTTAGTGLQGGVTLRQRFGRRIQMPSMYTAPEATNIYVDNSVVTESGLNGHSEEQPNQHSPKEFIPNHHEMSAIKADDATATIGSEDPDMGTLRCEMETTNLGDDNTVTTASASPPTMETNSVAHLSSPSKAYPVNGESLLTSSAEPISQADQRDAKKSILKPTTSARIWSSNPSMAHCSALSRTLNASLYRSNLSGPIGSAGSRSLYRQRIKPPLLHSWNSSTQRPMSSLPYGNSNYSAESSCLERPSTKRSVRFNLESTSVIEFEPMDSINYPSATLM